MAAILWCLWLKRNRRIFQGVDCNQSHLWDDIISLVAFWSSKSPLFCNYDASTIALN